MAKIDGFAHVGLYVNDADAEVKFYTEILGFKLIWESVNQCPEGPVLVKFVQNGNGIIEIVQFPFKITKTDGHFDHIAMNVEGLDEIIKELESKGIEFEEGTYTESPGTFEHGSRWILFYGPGGEHIELNEKFKA